MSKKALFACLLLASCLATGTFVVWAQDRDKDVPAKATGGGNYSGLLRKIEVPTERGFTGNSSRAGISRR